MSYPTKISVSERHMRYIGLYDFNALYTMMAEWLKQRGFWYRETKYKHTGDPTGAEVELTLEAERKITDYYKYDITIEFHIWDMRNVELNVEGKKKVMQHGRMYINLNAEMTLDWQGRWSKTSFTKFLRDFYNKHIIKETIEGAWYDTLQFRLYKLQNLIKEYLDMQTKWNEYAGYLGAGYLRPGA